MNAKPPTPDRTRASLELLYSISRELAAQLDLRILLQRILQLTLDKLGAASGSIVVFDDEGTLVEGATAYGGEVRDHMAQEQADTIKKGLAGWVLEKRQPALLQNTLDDPRWLRREQEKYDGEPRSAISVPLMAHERVVGVLTLVYPEPDHFTGEDLQLLTSIADQAGVAVQNAWHFASEQERRRFAATLQEIARVINSVLDPSIVFSEILKQLERVIKYDSASIMLLEDDRLRIVAARGFEDDDAVAGLTIPYDPDLLTGRVLSKRIPQVIQDVEQESGWLGVEDFPVEAGIRSWIGAPLVVRERAVGVLNVDSRSVGAYDAHAVEVVLAFADHAATAVANAQLFAETHAAEERYSSLFEDSIDPIVITDLTAQIVEANQSAAEFLGRTTTEILGTSVLSLLEADPQGQSVDLMSLESRESFSYNAEALHKGGTTMPVEVYVKRIDIGRQPVIQWILRDISERVELDALRADLTSMIFHDLRSPLGNVISSLEVLKLSLPSEFETQHSIVTIALRSGRRLSRLVESLLDLEMLESGEAVLEKSESSIGELITESAEEVHAMAEARKHSLEIDLDPKLAPVQIDADMIRRVVINLLENAVKYTRTGGTITLSALGEDEDVVVRVRDTGPGIPPDQAEHIFDKFARLRRDDSVKGLGLGLAFCRLAVEAHGGRIWVESKVGEGSTFIFTLPR